MTVPTVEMMPKKKVAHAIAETAGGQAKRKRRPRPPWGKLLGGKPIQRHTFVPEKIESCDEFTRERQYLRMQALLHHYGIVGHVPAYPKGLAEAEALAALDAMPAGLRLELWSRVWAEAPQGFAPIAWRL